MLALFIFLMIYKSEKHNFNLMYKINKEKMIQVLIKNYSLNPF